MSDDIKMGILDMDFIRTHFKDCFECNREVDLIISNIIENNYMVGTIIKSLFVKFSKELNI